MGVVRKNIIANYAGSVWTTLMGFIFIPIYIKFLGVESWGLIGIFTMLQMVLGLLDMGLSSTLNREMAKLSGVKDKEAEMNNLLRTFELVYWGIAILAGIIVICLSPVLTHYWIKAEHIPVRTVQQAITIMGIIIAIQLPVGLYSGGLLGLQRQVILNVVNVIISTLRGAGAVLILWLIYPSIRNFFIWQIVISLINVVLVSLLLWRRMPKTQNKPVFQKKILRRVWRFAAGMSGISLFGILLTQMDKIIVSKMVTLENFGYYMLASSIAVSLGRLISPVFISIYPRFTQLVSLDRQEDLKQLYHRISQFIAVIILPIACIIALFSYEIVLLWTRDPVIAEKSKTIVTLLICGTAINGLMHPPYALQLGFGWTRLSFFKNIIAVVVMVPLIIWLTHAFGPAGAAATWLIINLGYFFFEIPVMHLKLFPKEKLRWYAQDVFLPLSACLVTAGLFRILIQHSHSSLVNVILLVVVLLVTFMVTMIVTPQTRKLLVENLENFRKMKIFFKR